MGNSKDVINTRKRPKLERKITTGYQTTKQTKEKKEAHTKLNRLLAPEE